MGGGWEDGREGELCRQAPLEARSVRPIYNSLANYCNILYQSWCHQYLFCLHLGKLFQYICTIH